jgi:hypothetical protein
MLKTYVSAIKKIFQALATAQSDLLLTIREVGIDLLLIAVNTDSL